MGRWTYPLVIAHGRGEQHIPDEFASTCGLALERLAASLAQLYPDLATTTPSEEGQPVPAGRG
jgi:hypothetical protein